MQHTRIFIYTWKINEIKNLWFFIVTLFHDHFMDEYIRKLFITMQMITFCKFILAFQCLRRKIGMMWWEKNIEIRNVISRPVTTLNL